MLNLSDVFNLPCCLSLVSFLAAPWSPALFLSQVQMHYIMLSISLFVLSITLDLYEIGDGLCPYL